MFDLNAARAAVHAEGVFIGGWSLKKAFVPDKSHRMSVPRRIQVVADFSKTRHKTESNK